MNIFYFFWRGQFILEKMIYFKIDVRVTVNVEEESSIVWFERDVPERLIWRLQILLRSLAYVNILLNSQTLVDQRSLDFTFGSHQSFWADQLQARIIRKLLSLKHRFNFALSGSRLLFKRYIIPLLLYWTQVFLILKRSILKELSMTERWSLSKFDELSLFLLLLAKLRCLHQAHRPCGKQLILNRLIICSSFLLLIIGYNR